MFSDTVTYPVSTMSTPNEEQANPDGLHRLNEMKYTNENVAVSGTISSLNPQRTEGKIAAECYKRILCRGPHGGSGGEPFTDENMARHGNITRIAIRQGKFIYGVRFMYGRKWGPFHGDEIEGSYTEDNVTGTITQVVGRSAEYVDQLTFITEEGNMYGPYGGTGGRPFNVKFKEPVSLKYVSGQANEVLHRIAFHF